jgi:hypothetical protein
VTAEVFAALPGPWGTPRGGGWLSERSNGSPSDMSVLATDVDDLGTKWGRSERDFSQALARRVLGAIDCK